MNLRFLFFLGTCAFCLGSACISFIIHYNETHHELEKVHDVLNRVVSREIADEILRGQLHLGGKEKRVTVLFADIRGFTQMSAHMPPHRVIELLNDCMSRISHLIYQHGGIIDKYVGDEAMALFGAPNECCDSAYRAICSAINLVEELNCWNQERMLHGLPAVEMGIGIHTGEMLAGNMGAEERLNYTVVGSNVNLAARLCSAAKKMQILISEDALEESHVKENIIYEKIGPMLFKGFETPIEVFQVKGFKNA